jgi:hypothetical protein
MALLTDENATAGRITVWECIGCGRIENQRPCIGICQDRKTDFVYASVYDEALAQVAALKALIRQLACTTPRAGEWERTYRALQNQARQTLKAIAE